jgi:hypothetical protein
LRTPRACAFRGRWSARWMCEWCSGRVPLGTTVIAHQGVSERISEGGIHVTLREKESMKTFEGQSNSQAFETAFNAANLSCKVHYSVDGMMLHEMRYLKVKMAS